MNNPIITATIRCSPSASLEQLVEEVLPRELVERVHVIAKKRPLDITGLLEFDRELGGPGICNINSPQGSGRYAIPDRDIFRPLQYCVAYFQPERIHWSTRDIIQMCGLHMEMLVHRVGQISFIALGRALHNRRVRNRVGQANWDQLQRFAVLYNTAKHDVKQPKDQHLFSIDDAIYAYTVCRMLARRLFPLVRLTTPLQEFDIQTSGPVFGPRAHAGS